MAVSDFPALIDHVIYASPNLDTAVAEIEERFGVRAAGGGQPGDQVPRNHGERAAVAAVLADGLGESDATVNDYVRTTRRGRRVVDRGFWAEGQTSRRPIDTPYDNVIVEAHTVGQDNWTTLADLTMTPRPHRPRSASRVASCCRCTPSSRTT